MTILLKELSTTFHNTNDIPKEGFPIGCSHSTSYNCLPNTKISCTSCFESKKSRMQTSQHYFQDNLELLFKSILFPDPVTHMQDVAFRESENTLVNLFLEIRVFENPPVQTILLFFFDISVCFQSYLVVCSFLNAFLTTQRVNLHCSCFTGYQVYKLSAM